MIVDVEVVKVKVDHIPSSFDKHVSQNITDFKEVHSRLSKLRDEINEDIENTWKEVDRLNRWKWMFTGILLTLIWQVMTLTNAFTSFFRTNQMKTFLEHTKDQQEEGLGDMGRKGGGKPKEPIKNKVTGGDKKKGPGLMDRVKHG